MEHLSTIIVAFIILTLCVFSVIVYVKNKKKGGCCGCGSCLHPCNKKHKNGIDNQNLNKYNYNK